VIQIEKGDAPVVLIEKAAEWTQEYADYKAGVEDVPKAALIRYRHQDIKRAVIRDSHGKCIYCESKIRHTQPGHVEHMKPKAKFPELVCNWENLALVCHECNQRKGDKYYESPEMAYLNPYVDDPTIHIVFVGPLPLPRNGSSRGRVTIKDIGLDRIELIERRVERIIAVASWFDLADTAPDNELRDWYLAQAGKETDSKNEYAAMVRDFVRFRVA
jgi:uncharacterized protein (TIGR02646 family)